MSYRCNRCYSLRAVRFRYGRTETDPTICLVHKIKIAECSLRLLFTKLARPIHLHTYSMHFTPRLHAVFRKCHAAYE